MKLLMNMVIHFILSWAGIRHTGFSPAIGFTIEFKAKVINSPDGAFTVSGVGAGKGFRLTFSNNKLAEHANVGQRTCTEYN